MAGLLRLLGAWILCALSGAAFAAPCSGFTDVDDASPFCANLSWIYNRGITLGCAPGLYCPTDPVTRLQMAALLNRLGDALFPLTCAAGQVMKWNGTQWACASDDAGGSGTVTSLAQGAGITLTPNPLTTTGTIAADTAFVQRRVSATCAAGSSIRAIAADGTVTCQADTAGPANAFVQGGNAFGALAVLGTTDNRSLDLVVNGGRALRITPGATPNLVGGYSGNAAQIGFDGQTIGGGGGPGSTCFEPSTVQHTRSCANFALNPYAAVGGGRANVAEFSYATVAGGSSNTAGGHAAVGGGDGNRASGAGASVAGGVRNTGSGVDSAVGGGFLNSATDTYSTVAGGIQNSASGFAAVVSGGNDNIASMTYTSVGGGFSNDATADAATVAGGYGNAAQGVRAAVGGGYNNVAAGGHAVVAGGGSNLASGSLSTVGGGTGNQANGQYSTVPGGSDNQASGNYSVAMGRQAIVNSHGSFVFADGTPGTFISGVANEFIVGASGGVGFYTQKGFGTFCRMAGGAGTWSCSSSRHVKRDFAQVDPRDILDRVAALPVTSWRFKDEPASVRHLGPTAQDFRAAFLLGTDDESIATVDASGVALAAIQGLHRLVEDQNMQIAALLRRIADLEAVTSGRSKAAATRRAR